jgi:glycosyltransferase involved in cell wall biosynthesis
MKLSMTYNPLVSIIIPTYNRVEKVGSAIESALKQTYQNVQIIVVDDGSDDETEHIFKDYPGIEYVLQKHAGQAAARNNGLAHSRGTIVASLDSDDFWEPSFLERCVSKLEEDNLDFVFANWYQSSREGESWDFLKGDPFLKPHFKETDDHWVSLNNEQLRSIYVRACPSPSSSVVMRKSSIIHGWDDQINICDDWCMYLDMILSKECKVAFTLDKLWQKRLDEINIFDGRKRSEILKLLYIEDVKRLIERFNQLLSKSELQSLQRMYISSLVELSKHCLIREHNPKECLTLIKTAAAIDITYTLRTIPGIFMFGFKRHLTNFFYKKN